MILPVTLQPWNVQFTEVFKYIYSTCDYRDSGAEGGRGRGDGGACLGCKNAKLGTIFRFPPRRDRVCNMRADMRLLSGSLGHRCMEL